MEKKEKRFSLSARDIYWKDSDRESIKLLQAQELVESALDKDDLIQLVKALDRRLSQLWFKVSFEKENGLVNYEKIEKQLKFKG